MKKFKALLIVPIISFLIYGSFCYADNLPTSDNQGSVKSFDTVKVGFFCFPNYHIKSIDGSYSGMGYELYESLGRFMNEKIEYVGYDDLWPDNLKKLDNGEIDLLICSESRGNIEQKYICSNGNIGEAAFNVVIRYDDETFTSKNVTGLNGRTVGVIKGDVTKKYFDNFCKENNITCEIKEFDYIDDLHKALKHPKLIDAFVAHDVSAIERTEVVLCQFNKVDMYLITTKDKAALMDEVNAAIELLNKYEPSFLDETKEKYQSKSTLNVLYTAEEQAYIDSHSKEPIVVSCQDNIVPLSYFDGDEYNGILAEYLKLISKSTGLSFTVTNESEGINVPSNGAPAKLTIDSIDDFSFADNRSVKHTIPYISIPMSAVYASGTFKFYRVGMVIGNTYDYYTKLYNIAPERITYYSTPEDCIRGILQKEVDVAYFPAYCSQKFIYDNYSGQLVMKSMGSKSYDYCFGIKSSDDLILLSILNKAIYSIPEGEIDTIISTETTFSDSSFNLIRYSYEHPTVALFGVFILVSVIALIVILISRNEFSIREKKQAKSSLALLKNAFSSNDYVLDLDVSDYKNIKISRYVIEKEDNKDIEKIVRIPFHFTYDELLKNLHSEDKVKVLGVMEEESVDNIVKHGLNRYFEVRFLPDGKGLYHYFAISMQGLVENHNKNKSIVVFVKNIDSIMNEEEEKKNTLFLALSTARRFSRAKSDFMAQMSHDIRTPMNAIMGMSEIALLSAGDEKKVSRCLEQINKSSQDLIHIIDQIFEMTNIEKGGISFDNDSVNIKKCFTLAMSQFKEEASSKNITFVFDSDEIKDELVYADRKRLDQVFKNIIGNAIKYTDSDGYVEAKLVQSDATTPDRHVYSFLVKDNGSGMKPETLANLFVPFERGDALKYNPGIGLGMSIVKSIVDAAGGSISIESKPEKGTSVDVSICLSNEVIEPSEADLKLIKGKNALVVSNDEITLKRIKEFCSILEITPHVFNNHIEAINSFDFDEFNRQEYPFVFLNTLMPINDDMDAVRKIRGVLGNYPVIIDVTPYEFDYYKDVADEISLDKFESDIFSFNHLKRFVVETYKVHYDKANSMKKKSGYGRRALVVEDVEINRIFANSIVEMKGFTVDSVENGKEAVDALVNNPIGYYDIVLMDIQMPVMNGYEASQAIRAMDDPYFKKIPIIAMSANAFAEDAVKSRENGMNDHIAKPVDIVQFSKIIDKLFED